jgi:hypothetical protein
MTPADKVRENRLRRMASRRGLILEKCPRRDPGAIDYGTYRLVRASDGSLYANRLGQKYGMTLDSVERDLERYTP